MTRAVIGTNMIEMKKKNERKKERTESTNKKNIKRKAEAEETTVLKYRPQIVSENTKAKVCLPTASLFPCGRKEANLAE